MTIYVVGWMLLLYCEDIVSHGNAMLADSLCTDGTKSQIHSQNNNKNTRQCILLNDKES